MVVFTCNHCGDSLQKPRVEKHYMIACRSVKSLTCMDCLKDFKGEEYVAHTKCVSETQRYAAKGAVVQEVKKGEVKQENWTSLIKDIIIKNPDVPAQYLTHLEALSSINNVPRTKDKFVKFMQNSGRRCPHKDVLNGLWEFIEKHKGKFMEETNQEESNLSQPENKKRNRGENRKLNKQLKKIDNTDNERGAENQETGAPNLFEPNNVIKDVQEKPKKKNKSDEADKIANEEVCKKQRENGFNNEPDNAAVGIKKKDKKKKKNVSAIENPDTDKVNEDANSLKGIQDAQNQEITENSKDESIGENDSSIRVKPKKRKSDAPGNKVDTESGKKQKVNDFNDETGNPAVEIKNEMKKKKKKNSLVIENSNSNTKIADENINDLNDSQIVNNSSGILENHEIITENGKAVKSKNKKQCRASDFFTGDKEKVNNESDLVIKEKANKKNGSVENSFSGESFSLRDKILEVLGSKSSISLSKLQTRVLKAYGKTDGSISKEKLLKKFNRSLKKLSNVEINDDIVKLMTV